MAPVQKVELQKVELQKVELQKVERSKGRIFQIKFFLNVKKSQKIMFLIYKD